MALGLTPQQIIEKKKHPLLNIDLNWKRVCIKDLAIVQNGYAFSSKFFNHNTGLPLIRIRDIKKVETENLFSGEYKEEFIVRKNDILIGMDGDFNASKWPGKKGLLNQRVCRLLFGSELYEKEFLYICLQPYLNAINEETSSVTVKHLSSKTIKDIPLPLPPLPEQRAIVAKIEQFFSSLDSGIADLEKAQAQLKIYRQAVLKKAFEGELTREWREQQTDLPTAAELLVQIKEERKNHYQQQLDDWELRVKTWEAHGKEGKRPVKPKKLKESPSLTKEELEEFPPLPNEWLILKLGAFILSMCLGKMLDIKKNQGEYKPYLANINVRWGKFDLNNLKKMRFLNSESDKVSIIYNDLIICEGGEPGRCAVWKSDKVMRIQKALHRVRFHQSLTNSDFIFHFFKYSAFSGHLAKYFTGTTIKHLTGRGLEKLLIPIVSIREQHQIVQEIESRLSVCDKVEQTITESLEKSKSLRQSILKKAFEGRLLNEAELKECKNDPDYEPAGELLKKILVEKEKKLQTKV